MPNFMLMDRAVSEIQSTKVSFLGMDFAAKTRKTTVFTVLFLVTAASKHTGGSYRSRTVVE